MVNDLVYWLKRPYHLFKTGFFNGLPAQIRYRFPARKLKVIAITGTDGKTTSSTLLYHILKESGKKVVLVSTVAAYFGEDELDTGFHVTAPQPAQVQKLMRQAVDKGYEYFILEATSHGIFQYRTWGIQPFIAGLTNITHEHLDYHVTYENYVAAKAILLKQAQTAVINADDDSHSKIKRLLAGHRVVEYGGEQKLSKPLRSIITERFSEAFNQSNARLVVTIAQLLGISDEMIVQALPTFPGIKGRMQWLDTTKKLHLVVDFAHTPRALQEALTSIRKHMRAEGIKGRLIAVFGAAGLRDRQKRPIMTHIAVDLADIVVLTAEDPRTEDFWCINREMKEQLTEGHRKLISIADRREAINFAIKQVAKPGDVIGFFGKGHEQSMCYGKTEYPWDEVTEVKKAVADL